MRLFVAIDLPHAIKQELVSLQDELKRQDFLQATYPPPENLHLTLTFIGEVDDTTQSKIQEALSSISFSSFELCVGAIGVLPSQDKIHVIYVDLPSPELNQLALSIQKVLIPFVEPESRDFFGHVTIARAKKVFHRERLLSYLDSLSLKATCFPVAQFTLQQSTLSSSGPEYTVVESYSLK